MRCLAPLAALLLFIVPTVTEVVNSMSDCDEFLLLQTPPEVPGILESGNIRDQNRYKPICQTLNGVRSFVTLYDTENKIPVFSAYKYTGAHKGKRPECSWNIEPQLEDNKNMEPSYNKIFHHQAGDNDYKNSSLFDRGHLFPSFYGGTENAMNATFTLTNVVPQERNFNQKRWSSMENCIKCFLDEYCIVGNNKIKGFLVTGAQPGNNKLKNKINIPSVLWSAFCCYSRREGRWLANAHWDENIRDLISTHLQTKTLAQLHNELGVSVFPQSECPLHETFTQLYTKFNTKKKRNICQCPPDISTTSAPPSTTSDPFTTTSDTPSTTSDPFTTTADPPSTTSDPFTTTPTAPTTLSTTIPTTTETLTTTVLQTTTLPVTTTSVVATTTHPTTTFPTTKPQTTTAPPTTTVPTTPAKTTTASTTTTSTTTTTTTTTKKNDKDDNKQDNEQGSNEGRPGGGDLVPSLPIPASGGFLGGLGAGFTGFLGGLAGLITGVGSAIIGTGLGTLSGTSGGTGNVPPVNPPPVNIAPKTVTPPPNNKHPVPTSTTLSPVITPAVPPEATVPGVTVSVTATPPGSVPIEPTNPHKTTPTITGKAITVYPATTTQQSSVIALTPAKLTTTAMPLTASNDANSAVASTPSVDSATQTVTNSKESTSAEPPPASGLSTKPPPATAADTFGGIAVTSNSTDPQPDSTSPTSQNSLSYPSSSTLLNTSPPTSKAHRSVSTLSPSSQSSSPPMLFNTPLPLPNSSSLCPPQISISHYYQNVLAHYQALYQYQNNN